MLEAARLEAADASRTILAEAKQEADKIRERSLAAVSEYRKRLEDETRLYIIESLPLWLKICR